MTETKVRFQPQLGMNEGTLLNNYLYVRSDRASDKKFDPTAPTFSKKVLADHPETLTICRPKNALFSKNAV